MNKIFFTGFILLLNVQISYNQNDKTVYKLYSKSVNYLISDSTLRPSNDKYYLFIVDKTINSLPYVNINNDSIVEYIKNVNKKNQYKSSSSSQFDAIKYSLAQKHIQDIILWPQYQFNKNIFSCEPSKTTFLCQFSNIAFLKKKTCIVHVLYTWGTSRSSAYHIFYIYNKTGNGWKLKEKLISRD